MPKEFEDYYKILGIHQKATDKQIKLAYRGLVRKYHPDKNPQQRKSDLEFCKKIINAYEFLSDQRKRTSYDLNYNINITQSHSNQNNIYNKTKKGTNARTNNDNGSRKSYTYSGSNTKAEQGNSQRKYNGYNHNSNKGSYNDNQKNQYTYTRAENNNGPNGSAWNGNNRSSYQKGHYQNTNKNSGSNPNTGQKSNYREDNWYNYSSNETNYNRNHSNSNQRSFFANPEAENIFGDQYKLDKLKWTLLHRIIMAACFVGGTLLLGFAAYKIFKLGKFLVEQLTQNCEMERNNVVIIEIKSVSTSALLPTTVSSSTLAAVREACNWTTVRNSRYNSNETNYNKNHSNRAENNYSYSGDSSKNSNESFFLLLFKGCIFVIGKTIQGALIITYFVCTEIIPPLFCILAKFTVSLLKLVGYSLKLIFRFATG